MRVLSSWCLLLGLVTFLSIPSEGSLLKKYLYKRFASLIKSGAPKKCEGTRYYKFSFQGTWTSARQPENYPDGAGFSPVVLVSHSSAVSLFKVGAEASGAIQQIAETGGTSVIEGFLSANQGKDKAVLDYQVGNGPISGDGSVTLLIKVDGNHPVISFVQMVAPSPDWFTAGADINMCNEYGEWKFGYLDDDLNVYDAGTDSGSTFDSDNSETDPQGVITKLECGDNFCTGNGEIPSVGIAELELTCAGEKEYKFLFTGKLKSDGVGLTLGVLVSHSTDISLFIPGELAVVPGVEEFIEDGNVATLASVAASVTPALVLGVAVTDPIPSGNGKVSAMIKVDTLHPLLTYISRIDPSPDFFTGFTNLDMCDKATGRWKLVKYLSKVPAYDLGTEDGTDFSSDNPATDPQEPVSKIMKAGKTPSVATAYLRQSSLTLRPTSRPRRRYRYGGDDGGK